MLDKIVNGINKNIDSKIKLTSSYLLKYNPSHATNYIRIDSKNRGC